MAIAITNAARAMPVRIGHTLTDPRAVAMARANCPIPRALDLAPRLARAVALCHVAVRAHRRIPMTLMIIAAVAVTIAAQLQTQALEITDTATATAMAIADATTTPTAMATAVPAVGPTTNLSTTAMAIATVTADRANHSPLKT